MKAIGWVLLIALLGGVGLFAVCHGAARADPIVRTARIGFRDWPARTPPVRVLLASDIHLGNAAMDVPRLARIVAQIDALAPDVIVLAGDFVAGRDKAAARTSARDMVAPLSRLHARDGVIAVLGNHDEDSAPGLIARALTRAGIRVLRNDAVTAGPLIVAGIGDAKTGHGDVPRTLAAVRALKGIPIAVTHYDDRSDLHGRIRLLLDGHTHCGQIELAPYGLVNPAWGVLDCGLSRSKDGVMITTAGLGTTLLPLRLNAPPDVWIVTLGPASR